MDEGWVTLPTAANLPEARSTRVESPFGDLMLHRRGEQLFAIAARCTHQGAPLDRGPVDVRGSTKTVTCPLHGSMFDLATGRVLRGPATKRVAAFEARIVGGAVEVRPREGTLPVS